MFVQTNYNNLLADLTYSRKTFSDGWAPSSALALRSAGLPGALLLELAVPCVISKGIEVEEKKGAGK